MKKVTWLVGLCGVMFGAAAQANSGFYVNGSIGKASVDTSAVESSTRAEFATAGATPPYASSNTDLDTAFKISAGYMFNRYFGAELNYVDLGKHSLTVSSADPLVANGSYKSSGYGVSLVGNFPITHFIAAQGRLGVTNLKTSNTTEISGVATGYSSGSKSKNTVTVGVGVSYDLTHKVQLRADYDRYMGVSDSGDYNLGDANMMSIGVGYKF